MKVDITESLKLNSIICEIDRNKIRDQIESAANNIIESNALVEERLRKKIHKIVAEEINKIIKEADIKTVCEREARTFTKEKLSDHVFLFEGLMINTNEYIKLQINNEIRKYLSSIDINFAIKTQVRKCIDEIIEMEKSLEEAKL